MHLKANEFRCLIDQWLCGSALVMLRLTIYLFIYDIWQTLANHMAIVMSIVFCNVF